jgi:predicted PurR-regulated permease PerM
MQNQDSLVEKITFRLLLFGLIIVLLVVGKEILLPLTIAVFFSFLLLPVSQKLEQWRFPRSFAIILSIILAMTVFGAIIYFFYYQLVSFAQDWPQLQDAALSKIEKLQQFLRENFNISKSQQRDWLNVKMNETANSGEEIIFGLFSATGAFLANLALIPIYVFFITLYREKFKNFFGLILKGDQEDNVMEVVKKVSKVSQMYLKGIFLDVLILSILNSTGFLLLGIKHAILFGVLASVLNIIPYIGVLIGSILPVAMALLTKDEIGYALGAAGVSVFVQFLDNNFITPYVVGSSVSINPLTSVIALIVSAMVWGLPGMVLSIPLTGMLKVVCDNVKGLMPYGYLLGEEVDFQSKKQRNSKLYQKLRGKKMT